MMRGDLEDMFVTAEENMMHTIHPFFSKYHSKLHLWTAYKKGPMEPMRMTRRSMCKGTSIDRFDDLGPRHLEPYLLDDDAEAYCADRHGEDMRIENCEIMQQCWICCGLPDQYARNTVLGVSHSRADHYHDGIQPVGRAWPHRC